MVRFLLVLILFVCPVQVWSMGDLSVISSGEVLVGKSAPEFSLETTSQTNKSLTEAREGKKAILVFWATWCPHCREELESVSLKLEEVQSKGIKIILVNVGESREDAKAYLNHYQVPLDSFLDEDNTISGLYGVRGLPTTLLIDEVGMVRSVTHGFPYDYEKRFN